MASRFSRRYLAPLPILADLPEVRRARVSRTCFATSSSLTSGWTGVCLGRFFCFLLLPLPCWFWGWPEPPFFFCPPPFCGWLATALTSTRSLPTRTRFLRSPPCPSCPMRSRRRSSCDFFLGLVFWFRLLRSILPLMVRPGATLVAGVRRNTSSSFFSSGAGAAGASSFSSAFFSSTGAGAGSAFGAGAGAGSAFSSLAGAGAGRSVCTGAAGAGSAFGVCAAGSAFGACAAGSAFGTGAGSGVCTFSSTGFGAGFFFSTFGSGFATGALAALGASVRAPPRSMRPSILGPATFGASTFTSSTTLALVVSLRSLAWSMCCWMS